MAQTFPGGICDDDGTAAYLSLTGELVAVDLATGAIKWRRPDDSEPIAASDRFLITRRDMPAEPVIELRSTDSGDLVASLTAAQVPGFELVSPGDVIEAAISETPNGPEISWRSEQRHTGGAMRSALTAATGGSEGAVLLETATGKAHSIISALPPTRPMLEPTRGSSTTIAAARGKNLAFALKSEHGTLILEARNAAGELRWKTAIGTAETSQAGPLRQ